MRYLTAGESHGPELTAIIEGLPAGISLDIDQINGMLKKRQTGYGRGARMAIEQDQVRITSGLRHGVTLGSPLTLVITNKDHKNWQAVMAAHPVDERIKQQRRISKPRPGHADLVGGLKYEFDDLRNVLERSSARETAIRVAVGAVCLQLLAQLDIHLVSHVVNFGGISVSAPTMTAIKDMQAALENNDLALLNPAQAQEIKQLIDRTKADGDTLGGIIETLVEGLPAGIGSYTQWDQKLDGKLAQAVLSINAFKGVEFGDGFELGRRPGSQVMDEISWSEQAGYQRKTNHLGGFEGGMTTGERLVIRGVMKPIPTLYKPLMSVDIDTHAPYKAQVERSDPTALPAASLVMTAVLATCLAQELLDTFTSQTLLELTRAIASHRKKIREF